MINQTIQHTFSMRDQYIMAQALTVAIRELDKVPGAMKEVSNISDMQYLLDNYFDVYQQIHKLDVTPWVKTSVAERQIDLGRD